MPLPGRLRALLPARRSPVPDAVRGLPLEPGERRLAWATTPDGGPVVATDRGLHLPGAGRVDWPDVERASWRRPHLVVVRASSVEGSGQRDAVELVGDTDLADVVRAQVVASIAWSDHARLQPAGGVRVVGRRRRGLEVLDWQLVYDAGTDVDDPAVREQAEAVLLAARRTIG